MLGVSGALATVLGCTDPGDVVVQPTSTTAPTTSTVATPPAPATQPIHIDLDGVPQKFPPVRLVLTREGGAVVARLTTVALPPAEVDPGTGLRLTIPTGVEAVEALDGLDLPLASADTRDGAAAAVADEGAADTAGDGVLLDGGLRLLEPHAATVLLRGQPPEMTVLIDGKFAEPGGRPVDVHAELRVPVDVE